ncbi:MAG TPA: hypothetical protein VKA34_21905 [Balneolales bacterium]|nr:hypothetical protein [Balneolales bacterium]
MKINKQHDLLLYDSYQKKKENHSVREIFLYKEIISEFLEGFAKPGILFNIKDWATSEPQHPKCFRDSRISKSRKCSYWAKEQFYIGFS